MFIWRSIEVTEGAIWRMIPNKMCNCIVITKSIVMELEKKKFSQRLKINYMSTGYLKILIADEKL
jgi:hypothetical protein